MKLEKTSLGNQAFVRFSNEESIKKEIKTAQGVDFDEVASSVSSDIAVFQASNPQASITYDTSIVKRQPLLHKEPELQTRSLQIQQALNTYKETQNLERQDVLSELISIDLRI
ncbi:MAG: hypothetical protein AAGB12_00060 [Pseudomonadota bacterium]